MLIVLGLLLAALVVLPIIALVRTAHIRKLENRLEGVEAALRRVMRELEALRDGRADPQPAAQPSQRSIPQEAPLGTPDRPADAHPGDPRESVPQPAAPKTPAAAPRQQASPALEEIIGQRWLGWIAAVLILFAAAFFLKYAFDNRWIGEAGRVTIGILAGLGFVWAGWRRHLAGWRNFAPVLTGCGVTLVYLSTYASFGFYQLIDQTSAFAFLVLVVLQGHLLAVFYNSLSIALMAQVGGFLVPILLSTGQDRYGVLFGYLAVLNAGIVAATIARRWPWVSSVSFLLTHAMFWAWHAEHYDPDKRFAALLFQGSVFGLYLLADLTPQFRKRTAALEQSMRLFVNPFVFFATAYHLWESDYGAWMGAFAILMALFYAGLAWMGTRADTSDRRTLLVTIGVALAFVTLAIPIQLEANWISLGWGVQGVILAWISVRMRSSQLRMFSAVVFGLALFHHLGSDTPWYGRETFTPVANDYFLSAAALVGLLAAASYLQKQPAPGFATAALLAALALFWLAMTVETYTYSDALEAALPAGRDFELVRRIRWFGQSVLSVLWSLYAAGLVGAGFGWKRPLLRWAGLALFALTLLKVVVIDMSQLEQFYRIVAFLALGLLLLGVAWTYQRLTRREQPQ